MRPNLLVIVGPTASGKSALAVKLAKKLNGEIISADSRQVYKGLDIGSGKITKKEMQDVPHHLLDVANPKRVFSVAQYQKLAKKKITEITQRGKLPIIVGGTGFYIQAVVDNLILPEVKPNLKLRHKLEHKTPAQLYQMLCNLDKNRARNIDQNNKRRLIRAIEIAEHLGEVPKLEPKLEHRNVVIIGLNPPPEKLKKLIKIRLEKRLKSGLISEVKDLKKSGLSWQRLHNLGLEYRYVGKFLHENWSDFRTASEPFRVKREKIAPVFEELNTAIWHYAKRQLTWFKRDRRIKWFAERKQAERLAWK